MIVMSLRRLTLARTYGTHGMIRGTCLSDKLPRMQHDLQFNAQHSLLFNAG